MKVIGAGVGRTGTFSLKVALETLLGAPSYHMAEVFTHPEHVDVWLRAAKGEDVDWDALLDGYAAGVDWPICSFAIPLSERYPDALVLLSTRDFESWWKSASATIFQTIPESDSDWSTMIDTLFERTFTSQLSDKAACHEAFENHYRRIRENIPASRILEWEAKDGWAPLCDALGVPVPETPFPHRNTTEDFIGRRERQ